MLLLEFAECGSFGLTGRAGVVELAVLGLRCSRFSQNLHDFLTKTLLFPDRIIPLVVSIVLTLAR